MFFSPISEILGKVSDAEFEIWNAKIAKVVWGMCLIITNILSYRLECCIAFQRKQHFLFVLANYRRPLLK